MSEEKQKAKRPDPSWATKLKRPGTTVTYFLGWAAPSRAKCESCADDTWWRERGAGWRACLRCGLAARR